MNRLEKVAQRRVTDAFIGADPMQVTVIRQTRVKNARGGETNGAPTQHTLIGRIVTDVRIRSTSVTSPTGLSTAPAARVLVASYNADVKEEDRLVTPAGDFVVQSVWENQNFEVRAILTEA